MATFTSVGDNVTILQSEPANLLISISGTYNMTIALQKEVGSPGSGTWTTLREYKTPNATVSDSYAYTLTAREFFRLIVLVDNSGTATATLTASALIDPGESNVWGNITGTLSNQTDLQAALDDKVNSDDLGDLALLDTADEAQLADGAVTNAKIGDTEITKQKFASSVFEDNSGIQTGTATDEIINAAGLRHSVGLYQYVNGTAAAANITEITASHAGKSIDFDQNLTLDNAFGAGLASGIGLWVELVNVHASSSRTVTVEAGAGGTGTIDGGSSIIIPAGGGVVLTSQSNAGDQPVCRSVGDTVEIDFGARIVQGNLADVESDSGTLDAAQTGKIIVTSGNITIPTTTGFNCTLIAGGAHTVTFNSTTSAAMASGDVMSIVVQSATVIHAVLTASADKVTFS